MAQAFSNSIDWKQVPKEVYVQMVNQVIRQVIWERQHWAMRYLWK